MSTDYVLIDDGKVEVSILEHSNMFNLYVTEDQGDCVGAGVRNLTLEQLKELNQKLTNVISYFDDEYEGTEVKY